MQKMFNIVTVFCFCFIIFFIPIATVIEDQQSYLIYENREIAKPPIFDKEALFAGEYFPQWEVYYSDNIWKRNGFLAANTFFNMKILQRPVVNDVVIQDELLLPFVKFNEEIPDYTELLNQTIINLNVINDKVESYGGEFIYIGIPEQMYMFSSEYPDYLETAEEKFSSTETAFFSALAENEINYINMRDEFLKDEDYSKYYSLTDHHYNLFGAYFTYQKVIETINSDFNANVPMLTSDDFEFVEINNEFYGSRNRKLYNIYPADEHLYYYTSENPIPFERYDNGEKVESQVFSLPEDETVPVTYNTYMSGDIGETLIKTNREELPNALLFGDSFTNPYETFQYTSFNETVSLDLRHCEEKTILDYIDEYKPDYVFCIRDNTAYLNLDGNGSITKKP